MTEQTLARQLAAFAAATRATELPDRLAASVRQRILDILGLCVAAHRLPTSHAALDYVADLGGRAQAHVVGLPDRVPAAQAAFGNGVLAHSLDYDDTHLPSVLHPSAAVVPAALAAAQAAGADGAALTKAVAVGIEVTVRLGMAGFDPVLNNSVFFEHGQHATSICGAMGGAVAAGMLLGLDSDQLTDVLGVTASMAAGLIEANRTGGTVKRLHCGWAAHSAVTAADLVRRGFTGPPTVLEGRFGFYTAFLRGEADYDQITDGLGERWSVPDIFFKPYPANHFTHAGIDAGLALRAQGVPLDRITAIELRVPAAVIRTIGEPIATKRTPETGYQAQFSGPYTVVAGLLGGGGLGLGLGDFTDELARDPQRRALMALVEVVPDDECDKIFPYQFPAIVTVRTDDGRTWREEVLANRGGPQRPLSDAELAMKFRDNVAGRLSPETADQVVSTVLGLNEVNDVSDLLRPLTRLRPDAD
ncbi:MmgE/PrpD family protein [Micromonospora sp. NPDC048871]|uniref:MmgE/PrpD family protein n=1 Tax=unclassified Micromonospora TaxID=2617518 RepID=UPI002E0F0F41|nr:MmgE/PrpD family protein [Micromonospora sp. NBC_01739]